MANKLISQLDSIVLPLTGAEEIPLYRSGTVKTTVGALREFAGLPLGRQVAVLAAGATNNLALTVGTNIGFLDLNPTSGASNLTGIAAQYDGQILVVTNIHAANGVTLNALNGGSLAANQFRLPADITILQYSNVTFRYLSAISLWVPLS
jgi:hypothetical protein